MHFRFRGCKNRDDSHDRRPQRMSNEEALVDSTANRRPIQGESLTPEDTGRLGGFFLRSLVRSAVDRGS